MPIVNGKRYPYTEEAMLPEDTVAAMSGTPAERREDEAAYVKRNDGGRARKTRVF